MDAPETGPNSAQDAVTPAPTRTARLWAAALAAGALASALAWLAGEAAIRSLPTETADANVNGEDSAIVTVLSSNRSDVKRATLAYGCQGAILGLALGLAGAAVRRSAKRAGVAAPSGLVVGGAAGAGASFGLFPVFFEHLDPISGDLLLPLATHVAVWSAVGASGGLAFGIGLGTGRAGVARSALGGLIGAALGALAYEFLGAFFLPQAKTDQPFAAEAAARLLAQALTGLAAAAGVAAAARPGPTADIPRAPS